MIYDFIVNLHLQKVNKISRIEMDCNGGAVCYNGVKADCFYLLTTYYQKDNKKSIGRNDLLSVLVQLLLNSGPQLML